MRYKYTRSINAKADDPLAEFRPTHFRNLDDVEFLTSVRELLKGRWTQGSNALNERALPTSPMAPDAVQFCLRGACIHVLQPSPSVLSTDLHVDTSYISRKITDALGFTSGPLLVQWNDTQTRTEEDVIALLNTRIKQLKKEKRNVKLVEDH